MSEEDEKEYECIVCGREFDERRELYDHDCDTGTSTYETTYM